MLKTSVNIIIVLFLVTLFCLSGCKPSLKTQLEESKKHLENLGRACEVYAKDNNGSYPDRLELLVEKGIMVKTPACPITGKSYIYLSGPGLFIIKCPEEDLYLETGMVDKGFYPVFTSKEGLVLKGEYTQDVASAIPPTPVPVDEPSPTPEAAPEATVSSEETPHAVPTEASVEPGEIDPEAEEHNSIGMSYMDEEKYDLALEEFDKALSIEPDYIDAIKNKGNVYYYQNKPDKAIECYELSVAKDPSYWNGYNNIGNVYFDQGKIEDAEKYYLKAVEYCKDDIMPYNNLGDILIEQERYEEAIENYRTALDLGLENGELHSQMGFCYWQISNRYIQEKNEDMAMEYVNKALESLGKAGDLDPNDPYPHFRAGVIYFNFGADYFDKAIDCINTAIELAPENYTFFYSRGQICEAKGDMAGAKDDYEKALTLVKDAGDAEMKEKIEKSLGALEKNNQ